MFLRANDRQFWDHEVIGYALITIRSRNSAIFFVATKQAGDRKMNDYDHVPVRGEVTVTVKGDGSTPKALQKAGVTWTGMDQEDDRASFFAFPISK